MNLNQVTVPSQDVPKAISFYQKLGLKLIVHTHDRYARFLCPDGESTFSIHFVEEKPIEGIWVYFEVDNVEKKVRELIAAGVAFDTGVQEQSWLWTEARLKDPDGNQLIIYKAGENRKNPPWRIEDA
ncbi:MAG: VOC family protein [Flavobacteriaceae bacterium]|nr:VOC family protein [Flavobacteriaceae bacterium]